MAGGNDIFPDLPCYYRRPKMAATTEQEEKLSGVRMPASLLQRIGVNTARCGQTAARLILALGEPPGLDALESLRALAAECPHGGQTGGHKSE